MAEQKQAKQGSRLSPEDWAAAGLAMLARHGVGGIRLDALCRRLGVTKGSFYWHFKDRTALLAAILEYWRRTTTLDVIARLETAGAGPLARLRGLFEEGQRGTIDFGAEQAIRHWAGVDQQAAAAVRAVDAERLAYMEDLYRRLGLPSGEEAHRAAMYYAYFLGDAMIRRQEGAADRRRRQDLALDAFLSGLSEVAETSSTVQ